MKEEQLWIITEEISVNMQQQLDKGVYKIDHPNEKPLLDKLHKRITNELQAMDIDMNDFKDKRKYLV